MIVDITNELLTELKTLLVGTMVVSSYQNNNTKFPIVVVEEIDNYDDEGTKDSSGYNFCDISIRVEIYTEGQNRMSAAKALRNSIDSLFSDTHGLRREAQQAIPNFSDANVFRYQITYTGLVDKNRTIYGR